MKDEFKESALGRIPKNWEVVSIESICSVKGRIGFRGYTKSDLVKKGDGALTIGAKHISNDLKLIFDNPEYIRWFKYEESPEIKVQIGDILFVQRGSLGKAALVLELDEPATINPSMVLFKNIKCNNVFFYYCLTGRNIQDEVSKVTTSTAVPMISQKQIKEFKIPLPPLPEQQKIADILNTVNNKQENLNSQITEYTDLKKGLMQKLLVKGIGHTKFKVTPLGEIPTEWEGVKLGELGDFSKGRGIMKSEVIPHGLPCIRYGEIYTVHNFIIKKFHSFISEELAQKSKSIKKNDIIFAGSGETVEDIGKAVAYIGDEEAFAGGDTIILSPKEDCNSMYLSYCLNDAIVTKQRAKFGQGNSVVHISSRNLAQIFIPKPPLKEQIKIASILSSIDDKLESLQSKKQEYTQLKKELMEKLLTGKIRVTV